jgi:SAM-dependent methyltransferase
MRKKKIVEYATSESEDGKTYELIDVILKEKISTKEILNHWEARAQRLGIQAVMSARHEIEKNIRAAKLLEKDIFKFLKGYLEGKEVFELGCGIGRMTKPLAERAKSVFAIDFSTKMISRARENLKGLDNVKLKLGKISDVRNKSFDLVFETIVLLHILNPEKLKKTVEKMKSLSELIFICEHTYEGPDFPISKYSILRKPEEYVKLFKPFKLVKQKTHFCAGDRFTMMLFNKE